MELTCSLEITVVNRPEKKFTKPRPDASRLLAYDIISEVNQRGGYSNLLLPQVLTSSELDERDRAFATELVYGTIRMQGLYDYIFSQISDRPWSEVDADIVDLARIGAHQIFTMRTPMHAAVSATVDVARKRLGESKGSFINALMTLQDCRLNTLILNGLSPPISICSKILI